MGDATNDEGRAPGVLPLVETRPLSGDDMDEVRRLLDEAMGAGFWGMDPAGSHRVAVMNGRVVGVASANIVADTADIIDLPGPVCVMRLVAVDPSLRGRGLATRLVREVCAPCEREGAVSLLSFAWVHASDGHAPVAGVLQRLGFTRARRIEGFYAGSSASRCPGCGGSPCTCAADVYWRRAGLGSQEGAR